MQKYYTGSLIHLYKCGRGSGPSAFPSGCELYPAAEADAAIAARDARIAELEKALRFIEPHRKWLEMCCESLHKRAMYSEENTCDQAAAAIGSALIALNEPNAEEHPDSARLDKLPACFHMLRTYPGARAGEEWWLTTDPRTSYATVREAIDAHKGDTNGPL